MQGVENYKVVGYAAATVTRSGTEFSGLGEQPVIYTGVIEDGQVIYPGLDKPELRSHAMDEPVGADVIALHNGPATAESPASLPIDRDERLRRARAIGGISTSRAARQQLLEANQDRYRSELRAIEACLAPLYNDHPYLAPGFLRTVQQSDNLYRRQAGYVDPALDYSEPESRL